jgi:hypothetical protein
VSSLRTWRCDPEGYFALRRYRDRIAAAWRPCPVFGALAMAAEAEVAESDRRREAARIAHNEAARRFWRAAHERWMDEQAEAARLARSKRGHAR